MPEIGQTLSHFRLVEKIGQGGMGEVYLADDTTLDRKVALKFLPEAFTSDPERMARFEREAKLLASLNHPNIAGIHGLEQADGNRFLVLEYVEGETLQARLSKGALPLEDALALFRQIAEGLEAAHEKGVIHRDLKPANVMITAEEKVKILDFGLAKAFSDDTQSIDSSQSPTLTEAMTRPGVILGTAAYMSPEQAKGKSVDKRADIWAFGCILYECLTGKRAFEGETVTETLAAVLRGEPAWDALSPNTPQNIRFILQKCLEKEKSRRFRNVADTTILLEEPLTTSTIYENIPHKIPRVYIMILILIGLLVGILTTYIWNLSTKDSFSKLEPVKTYIIAPDEVVSAFHKGFALSPDSKTLIFSALNKDGSRQLWKRKLEQEFSEPIVGTTDGTHPFWSPDGRKIAFFVQGALRCIDVNTGQVETICKLNSGMTNSGSWSASGDILFQGKIGAGVTIFYVSGENKTPISLPGFGDEQVYSPHWLPEGRQFLFARPANNNSQPTIFATSIDSTTAPIPVISFGNSSDDIQPSFVFAPPGYLFFNQADSLSVQKFDPESLTTIGRPVPLAGLVGTPLFWFTLTAVGNHAVMLAPKLTSIGDPGDPLARLKWFDRNSVDLGYIGPIERYFSVRISPNGRQIAANPGRDIWVYDESNSAPMKITSDLYTDISPVWSPNGEMIAYSRFSSLFVKPAAPGGEEIEIFNGDRSVSVPTDWSNNDRYILFYNQAEKKNASVDIWYYDLQKDSPSPWLATDDNEFQARFSPDGKWIAYASDRNGLYDIFLLPFEGKKTPKPVSSGGGQHPVWGKGGKELFYLGPNNEVMVVDVSKLNTKGEVGRPSCLLTVPINDITSQHFSPYDYDPNSDRFIVNIPEDPEPLLLIQGLEELVQKGQ